MAVVLAMLIAIMFNFGEATWVHPSLEGGICRDGSVYTGSDSTYVAVGIDEDGEPVIPLGTELTVCRLVTRECLDVVVQDTGLIPATDLDLSPAAFEQLAPLAVGRINILWRLK